MTDTGGRAENLGQSFKTLFEQCLQQAGLSNRALRQQVLRQTGHDFPETTIDSWRRVHSTTGQLVYPGDAKVQVLAEWLCARPGVTVTEEELLAALRSDKAARATSRSRNAADAADEPTAGSPSAAWPGARSTRGSSTPPSTWGWTPSSAGSTTTSGNCSTPGSRSPPTSPISPTTAT